MLNITSVMLIVKFCFFGKKERERGRGRGGEGEMSKTRERRKRKRRNGRMLKGGESKQARV